MSTSQPNMRNTDTATLAETKPNQFDIPFDVHSLHFHYA